MALIQRRTRSLLLLTAALVVGVSAVQISDAEAAPSVRDQGQIFGTDGIVDLGTDSWSQSITTGIGGRLTSIEFQIESPLPGGVDFDFAVFAEGNPPTGSALFFEHVRISTESEVVFTWDVSAADLSFNVGDVFTFTFEAQEPGVVFAGNDGPGYDGGELFKNGVAPPEAETNDVGFITYVEPDSAALLMDTLTNGHDADVPPGPYVVIGEPVAWEYRVSNPTDVEVTDVAVVDDQGIAVSCPLDVLGPDESMTCMSAGVARLGQYVNVGSVTAMGPGGSVYTAEDPSHYLGVDDYSAWTEVAAPKLGGGGTATLLKNGKVLVVHSSQGGASSNAEIYIPWRNRWKAAASTHGRFLAHTTTLLKSGKVLVVGDTTAEIYTPWTDSWEEIAGPAYPRRGHTATRMPNGKVFIFGGPGPTFGDDVAEIYAPWTDTWSEAAPVPNTFRTDRHTATLVDGHIVIAGGAGSWGGANGGSLTYRIVTDEWVGGAGFAVNEEGRYSHTATLLKNGLVLVAGGDCRLCADAIAEAETYKLSKNEWTSVDSMSTGRFGHSAVLLKNNRAIVLGGSTRGLHQVEAYTPWKDTWAPPAAANIGFPESVSTATRLRNGGVLVIGGSEAHLFRPWLVPKDQWE